MSRQQSRGPASLLIRSLVGATPQNASLQPAAGDKNAHAACHLLVQSAQRKPSVARFSAQPPRQTVACYTEQQPKTELGSHCQWPLGGRCAPSGQAGASSDGHGFRGGFSFKSPWVNACGVGWTEHRDSDSLSESCPGVGCPSMFSVSDRNGSSCDLMGDLVFSLLRACISSTD
jgi:hypothetical protein